MQRRSIFSGLLFILIGVLFLLYYFHPELGIGRLFWRYWPAILILWGVAKLFDHFAAQRAGQPRPPAISGGEVALLVLLFLVFAGIFCVEWARKQNPNFDFSIGLFVHPYTSSEELPAQPIKPGEHVVITTEHGNINVRPAEGPEIRVIVHKTVNASGQQEADNRAGEVRVALTRTHTGFTLEPQAHGSQGTEVKVDLEVRVPADTSIKATSDRGDISISQMNGALDVTCRDGDLEIHGQTGDVTGDVERGDARIDSVKGNLRLSGNGSQIELSDISGDAIIYGEFYGPIRVHNVAKTTSYTSSRTELTISKLSGQMEMDAGRVEISDAPGSLRLVTRNKDVTLENVGGRIDLNDRHGDIEVRCPQPPRDEITITDESGNIDLILPEASSFQISATSHSGDVQSDFDAPSLKAINNNGTGQLEGKIGIHGPRISLETTYGTISLRKAT